jgi:heme/copper-type cytochrome/quinol oxidase subunit 4|tara:strand:- start:42 stop:278 length:237 start_codon:yes stop_codon:yes gene_type:complete
MGRIMKDERNNIILIIGLAVLQAVFSLVVIFQKLPEPPTKNEAALHRRMKLVAAFFALCVIAVVVKFIYFNTAVAVFG